MANALHASFKQLQLGSLAIDFLNEDIIAILTTNALYTYSAAHDFLDDITIAGRLATSDPLENPTITNGVFDADNVIWTAVGAGNDGDRVMLVASRGGSPDADPIVAMFDTGTNIPVTPNGSDITCAWNSGSSRIFAL